MFFISEKWFFLYTFSLFTRLKRTEYGIKKNIHIGTRTCTCIVQYQLS